jgi:hypothetical protein
MHTVILATQKKVLACCLRVIHFARCRIAATPLNPYQSSGDSDWRSWSRDYRTYWTPRWILWSALDSGNISNRCCMRWGQRWRRFACEEHQALMMRKDHLKITCVCRYILMFVACGVIVMLIERCKARSWKLREAEGEARIYTFVLFDLKDMTF